jgi:diguanylate cyclase (GGDEF)-like protein/PAS domain S-box-containing protein
MREQTESAAPLDILKRVVQFVGIGVVGTWASVMLPGGFDGGDAILASALAAILVVGASFAPWDRMPQWTRAVTPILFLGVIALVREATGGASSGLGALVLLPIIWLALYGTRAQIAAGVIATGAVFLVPIVLIGGSSYPPQEWVRGGTWMLTTAVAGFTIHGLVASRRRHSEAFRASSDLLEGTLHAATQYAIVATDSEGIISVFNSGAEQLLGYRAEEMVGIQRPWVYHDMDELEELASAAGQAVSDYMLSGARSGEPEARRFTYLHKDGTRIPVELTISANIDSGGSVSGFIGVATDIRDRLHAENALRASEGALQAVFEVSKQIAGSDDARQSICDAALNVCEADIAALMEPEGADRLRMTAVAGTDVPEITVDLGREPSASGTAFETGTRVFVPEVEPGGAVATRISNSLGVHSVLCEPVRRDGVTVAVLTIGWHEPSPALSARIEIAAGLLASDAGVAIERGDLMQRLEGAALTDGLTGLANRRAWDETLSAALRKPRAAGRRAAIAMFDLDHFKRYNDTHGHQAGDRLLVEVSAAWRDQLREGDVLARYGGEEFVLLLPNCTAADARHVTERIRRATPAGVTCSAGLALVEDGEAGDTAVARADVALYEAKESGRDRLLEYPQTRAAAKRPAAYQL